MTEAALELFIPVLVADIIDNGIAAGNKNLIYNKCALMLCIGFIGLVLSVTAQYFAASASVSFTKAVKHGVYEKIQRLTFAEFDKIGIPTLITRLTADMESIQNGLNLTLRLLLRSPFVVVGACIMAMRLDFKASIVFLAAVPLLAAVIFGIMAITVPLNKNVRSSLDGALLTTRETITGARVIRAFGCEEEQVKEFSEKNSILTKLQEKAGRISALLSPLTCLIINAAVSVLIYVGASRVNLGAVTCGTVVALYNYMSQILTELIKFADLTVTLTKSAACGRRISELLETDEAEKPDYSAAESSDGEDYISLENVGFTYAGAGEPALSDVSFSVKKGEKIGIIGSTGSGKSTLVSLIAGFYRPTQGNIYIDGKNILSCEADELSSKIAFAEQKPVVFKGTVRENLTLGKRNAADDELISALKATQADEFVCSRGGLDAETEQYGRNFSGGQRQRLSVARALVKDAEILITDDASSALDYMTDMLMRRNIDSLPYSAVFIVSQRTGSIMNCDKIVLLDDGKAVVGTHRELLETSEVYREIHYSQFEQEDDAI